MATQTQYGTIGPQSFARNCRRSRNTAIRVITVLPKNAPKLIINSHLPALAAPRIGADLCSNENKKYTITHTMVPTKIMLLSDIQKLTGAELPLSNGVPSARATSGRNESVICGAFNRNCCLNVMPAPAPNVIPITMRESHKYLRLNWKYHSVPRKPTSIQSAFTLPGANPWAIAENPRHIGCHHSGPSTFFQITIKLYPTPRPIITFNNIRYSLLSFQRYE